jgi:hypothetical protein
MPNELGGLKYSCAPRLAAPPGVKGFRMPLQAVAKKQVILIFENQLVCNTTTAAKATKGEDHARDAT